MVKARKAKKTEPERVTLRFTYDLVRDLPAAIARYAVLQPSEAQRGLSLFVARLKPGLDSPGDGDIAIGAPVSAWNWMISHALHFAPDFCESLIVQIADHEERAEREVARRARDENNAALKQAADELREREREEAEVDDAAP